MKTITAISSLTLAALLAATTAGLGRSAATTNSPRPVVEIALLLDTSNSMDGLIDQAKGQLWKIVNEFIKARQHGKPPELRVALFEYGKSSLPVSQGYIRLIQPLTNDLDRISEELFALKTNGGEEFCGWVIRDAVTRLDWSSAPEIYRAIFIAGNEPFTQGPVSYAQACKAAIAKGIVINTIHCGSEAEGRNGKWQDGAQLADGKYMIIDQNRAVVHFDAPQDQEIAKLSVELNKTYVPYGRTGAESLARQAAQDANAASLAPSGALVGRALTKASLNYRNEGWDLVDALNSNSREVTDLKTEELPPEMQKMTAPERQAFVESKAKERAQLQNRILQLNEERNKFIAAQARAQSGTNTLDSVVIATIRDQASKKNYNFE